MKTHYYISEARRKLPITFFKTRQLFFYQQAFPSLLPPLHLPPSLSLLPFSPSLRRPLRVSRRWSKESWKLNYTSLTDKSPSRSPSLCPPFTLPYKAPTRLLHPVKTTSRFPTSISMSPLRKKNLFHLATNSKLFHIPVIFFYKV